MTLDKYVAGLLATSVVVAGCASKPSDPAASWISASNPPSQSTAASASTQQSAPTTGEPGSGSNNEAEGRLNCQTLSALGVTSQSVSTIVDSTMQVNPGMSRDAATADLVKLVHLYCPQFDDQLQRVTH